LGQIVGASTIARDITERKQAKERLKESENRLSAILRSIQTGIVIIDPETHHIVEANATALRWIGALREEVVGSVCHKFICPAEIGRCPITDLGQTVNNSERVLLSIKGEECPIIKTASYVTIGGRQHLLESFVDIMLTLPSKSGPKRN
jgi:PAS domain S-box-containing protein